MNFYKQGMEVHGSLKIAIITADRRFKAKFFLEKKKNKLGHRISKRALELSSDHIVRKVRRDNFLIHVKKKRLRMS